MQEMQKDQQVQKDQQDQSNERLSLLSHAQILFDNNEFGLAKNILGSLITKNPDDVEVLHFLSRIFIKKAETKNAIKCLQNIHQICSDPKASVDLAQIYFENNENRKSEIYFLEALEHSDISQSLAFVCFKYLGNIYVRKKDLATAEEYYNRALRINSSDEQLFINYASLNIQRNDIEKAKEYFQLAIEQNPKSSGAWTGLALIHKSLSDSQLFWANIQNALESDPYNENAIKLLADSAILDQEYEYAIKQLKIFLEAYPENIEVNIRLACVLYQAGKMNEVLWEVQKIKEFEPKHPDLQKLIQIVGS